MATDLTQRRFQAVIFDMDGTLIDSTPAVVRSWTIWAEAMGVTAQQLEGFHGVPAGGVVEAVLPPDKQQQGRELIDSLELNDTEGIVPLPGAVDALKLLPADRIAIATSSAAPLAAARLRASGLTAPNVLVTVDDVEHGKPAPDPYLKAAELLGFDPSNCLVVEDAPKGLESARAAGTATLAVITTSRREELHADLVVNDLSEVDWVINADGTISVRVRSAA